MSKNIIITEIDLKKVENELFIQKRQKINDLNNIILTELIDLLNKKKKNEDKKQDYERMIILFLIYFSVFLPLKKTPMIAMIEQKTKKQIPGIRKLKNKSDNHIENEFSILTYIKSIGKNHINFKNIGYIFKDFNIKIKK